MTSHVIPADDVEWPGELEHVAKDEHPMGWTPYITLAARRGQNRVVQYLLEHGASANTEDADGNPALYLACAYGYVDVLKTLLSNGACIESSNEVQGWTPLFRAVASQHDSQIIALISAGANVSRLDQVGLTALHYAAKYNRGLSGALLVEAGADADFKSVNVYESINPIYRVYDEPKYTPLDFASDDFKAAILHTRSFRSKKTICVVGNTRSGKSTLIASLQNKKAQLLTRISDRIFGVTKIRERTEGIKPICLTSEKHGDTMVFDFAGQPEYEGPHEVFLESILKIRSSVTIIFVVNVTEEESAISQYLYRWLTLISKMCTRSNPVSVLVIGSFIDKAKFKSQARDKLLHCLRTAREDLGDATVLFNGTFFLDCRQPHSIMMDLVWQCINKVPTPQFKFTDIGYCMSWVVWLMNKSLNQKAIQFDDFSRWVKENELHLPSDLPPTEKLCHDLSVIGHSLYLPHKGDQSKSWLVLDLPAMLHTVCGVLFSPTTRIVDPFGLLGYQDMPQLFPDMDEDMICKFLTSLDMCVEVDTTLLRDEIVKQLRGASDNKFLFFPALVSANPPKMFQDAPCGGNHSTVCWQIWANDMHFISPYLSQSIVLRLGVSQVFGEQPNSSIKQHSCSFWRGGISWQSHDGVHIAIQIHNNVIVQVMGAHKHDSSLLFSNVVEIAHTIISTIRQLSPNLSAVPYIVHEAHFSKLMHDPKASSPHQMFPVDDILSALEGMKETCSSLPDQSGQSQSLPISTLLLGARPSQDVVSKLALSDHLNGECYHLSLLSPTHVQ